MLFSTNIGKTVMEVADSESGWYVEESERECEGEADGFPRDRSWSMSCRLHTTLVRFFILFDFT